MRLQFILSEIGIGLRRNLSMTVSSVSANIPPFNPQRLLAESTPGAAILNQAGEKALVILDEIGRGTATFDGLSIAWATLEHLHEVNRCRAINIGSNEHWR